MKYYGLDIGSSRIRFVSPKGQMIVNEPSVIIQHQNSKLIWGERVFEWLHANPQNSKSIIHPFEKSAISHYEPTVKLLKEAIYRAHKIWIKRPPVITSIYAGTSHAERQALQQALTSAGFGQYILVPRSVLSLLGSKVPLNTARSSALLEIGHGSSEFIISCYGDLTELSHTNATSGSLLIESLSRYIHKRHKVRISADDALSIMQSTDSLSKTPKRQHKVSAPSGKPVMISSAELRPVFTSTLAPAIKLIQASLSNAPVQALTDLMKTSIILSGGVSSMRFIDKYIQQETGMKFTIGPPQTSIAGINFIQTHSREYQSSLIARNLEAKYH